MGVSVAFSYATWIARYPEFMNVNQTQAQEFFNEATVYFRNDGGGPVSSSAVQSTILNQITAHIAYLAVGTTANPATGLVGRISAASEGSVSVSTELPQLPGSAAWFSQSQYGLSAWRAMAVYRTFRYRAARAFDPGARRW